jgi:peroxiredoxin
LNPSVCNVLSVNSVVICCTLQTHLPGYVEKFDQLKAKGVEVIACVSVNDPFVMDEWGKAHKATGKVCTKTECSSSFGVFITGRTW